MDDRMTDIEKILAEREKIDTLLKSKFSKTISIMFTDIKGSTSFYESRGDIDGRAMVHRHNSTVLPLLERHKGELLKTIGDATMTVFDDPSNAVESALAIQRKLREENSGKPAGEQIHVRIGINYGTAIIDKGDVFGDVVNVASRVESLASADEIFITGDMYREVKSNDEFIFRFVDEIQVKGKTDPIKVYRVVWHEEMMSMGVTRTTPPKSPGIFVLEASLMGNKLKISGFERAGREERAVKSYKEINFSEDKIKEYSKGIIDLLNRANRRGKISSDLLTKLKDYGKLIFDELIPASLKEKLIKTQERNLIINIDDNLVFIPWELLYDGKSFFCNRFSMGRSVSTRQKVSTVTRALGRPLKMQVLADPGGDLKASYTEGLEIKNEIGVLDEWINVTFKSTDIRTDYVKAKMRNFDIVHYAGHAEHDAQNPEKSGWLMKDGMMDAEDVVNMSGAMPMPSLVFSNACQSGHSDEWKLKADYEDKIFGLANAFLLSGVQHYIGTFWEIPDEAGAYFATCFYKNVAQGVTIGESMRLARRALVDKYGEDTIVWASYMLYGDPTTSYIHDEMDVRKQENVRTERKEVLAAGELRHKEDVISLGGERKTYKYVLVTAVVALLGFIAFLLYSKSDSTDHSVRGMQTAGAPTESIAAKEKEDAAKRIDELVASLARDFREGAFNKKKEDVDPWSSRPVTIVFMDVKSVGGDPGEDGKKILTLLPLALQDEERVKIVERELLDKLLQELKLSQSDLANPMTSLQIGKLFSANVIMTAMLIPDKQGLSVVSKFIDTETSQVRKVIRTQAASRDADMDLVNNMAASISVWVKDRYPLKGRVLALSGDRCQVNIGQMHGVKQGDILEVLAETAPAGVSNITGEVEIREVEGATAWASLRAGSGSVKIGSRVREKKKGEAG